MTAKADRVRALVNDPDLQEAFRDVRQVYLDRVDDPGLSDQQVLKIRDLLHVLREVEASLVRAIEIGDYEDFKAREKEETDAWTQNSRTVN